MRSHDDRKPSCGEIHRWSLKLRFPSPMRRVVPHESRLRAAFIVPSEAGEIVDGKSREMNASLIAATAIMIYICAAQLCEKPFNVERSWRGVIIIGGIGLANMVNFSEASNVAAWRWIVLLAVLLICAVGTTATGLLFCWLLCGPRRSMRHPFGCSVNDSPFFCQKLRIRGRKTPFFEESRRLRA